MLLLFSEKDNLSPTALQMIFMKRRFLGVKSLFAAKKTEKSKKSVCKIVICMVYCMGIPEENSKL